MIVATYVISNIKENNTKVTWTSEWENRGAAIQTGDNDLHLQGVFCQTSATHRVEKLQKMRGKIGPNDYRLVFSARATMHFQTTEEMRLERTCMHMYGLNGSATTKELEEVRGDYKYVNILHEGRSDTPEFTYERPTRKGEETLRKRKIHLLTKHVDDNENLVKGGKK